jgi:hypothetical protein
MSTKKDAIDYSSKCVDVVYFLAANYGSEF